MRILYVSKATFPSEVTHTLSMMRMCQALADSGHDVTLAGIRAPVAGADPFEYYGLRGGFRLEAFRYPSRVIKPAAHVWNVHRLSRNLDPQLVYARLCVLPLLGVSRKVPLVFEMHTPGPVGESMARRTVFERVVLHRTRVRIVVTTHLLRDYLRERYPSLDVVVARLSAERPVDLDPAKLAAFKAAELLGSGSFHVGYTGFIDRSGLRGTGIICGMAAKMPDVSFHVVGGPEDVVRYWRERTTSTNVHFYGHQNPAKIPWYLGCFDVVLAPVQLRKLDSAPFGRNLSPLKLPQYFAYGCAIVGSDLPAHHELIRDGDNGLLVPFDDVDAWVHAVRRLQQDPGLNAAVRRAAYAAYEREFTPLQRVHTVLEGLEV